MSPPNTSVPGIDAAVAADALLRLHSESQAGQVLVAGVAAGAELGTPFALAFFAYDAGVSAWHLTALLGPDGDPAPLETLGVPLGPLTLDAGGLVPADHLIRLCDLLGTAWGVETCSTLERELDICGALVESLGPEPGASTALVALLHEAEHAPLVRRLLEHIALALRNTAPAVTAAVDGVRAPESLLHHLSYEISRAQRYRRPLSVVYVELGSHDEVARVGPLIGHRLRRWDAIGRPDDETPGLLAILPETSGDDAQLFVKRNAARFGEARPGIASMPEDGATVERLLTAARGRAVAARRVHVAPPGEVWIREGSAAIAWQGRMPDQVRCPVCSALYLRPRRTGAPPADLEQQREAARVALGRACPDHAEQLTV